VLFQPTSPDQVFASFYCEPVTRKRGKDGVVRGKRARSYMENSQSGIRGGRHCSQCDTVRNVVNWNHVNSIIDIGDKSKLNAPFCKAPDEIVRIGDWIAH
jgi:hypothetical protein